MLRHAKKCHSPIKIGQSPTNRISNLHLVRMILTTIDPLIVGTEHRQAILLSPPPSVTCSQPSHGVRLVF